MYFTLYFGSTDNGVLSLPRSYACEQDFRIHNLILSYSYE